MSRRKLLQFARTVFCEASDVVQSGRWRYYTRVGEGGAAIIGVNT